MYRETENWSQYQWPGALFGAIRCSLSLQIVSEGRSSLYQSLTFQLIFLIYLEILLKHTK